MTLIRGKSAKHVQCIIFLVDFFENSKASQNTSGQLKNIVILACKRQEIETMLLSFSEYTNVLEYVEACLASGSSVSATACCSLLRSGSGGSATEHSSGVPVDAVQSIYLQAAARRMKKLSYSLESPGASSKISEVAEVHRILRSQSSTDDMTLTDLYILGCVHWQV